MRSAACVAEPVSWHAIRSCDFLNTVLTVHPAPVLLLQGTASGPPRAPAPMRIWTEYQWSTTFNASRRWYVQNSLVPAAVKVLQKFLKVGRAGGLGGERHSYPVCCCSRTADVLMLCMPDRSLHAFSSAALRPTHLGASRSSSRHTSKASAGYSRPPICCSCTQVLWLGGQATTAKASCSCSQCLHPPRCRRCAPLRPPLCRCRPTGPGPHASLQGSTGPRCRVSGTTRQARCMHLARRPDCIASLPALQ